MAYIVPICAPCSSIGAVYANLVDPVEKHLAVARQDRVDVFGLSENGLAVQHSIPFSGGVELIKVFRPGTAGRKRGGNGNKPVLDALLVVTASSRGTVVMFYGDRFVEISAFFLTEQPASGIQQTSGSVLAAVDSGGSVVALHCDIGSLVIARAAYPNTTMETLAERGMVFSGFSRHPLDVINVLGLAFLPNVGGGSSNSKADSLLAVLCRAHDTTSRLRVLDVASNGVKFRDEVGGLSAAARSVVALGDNDSGLYRAVVFGARGYACVVELGSSFRKRASDGRENPANHKSVVVLPLGTHEDVAVCAPAGPDKCLLGTTRGSLFLVVSESTGAATGGATAGRSGYRVLPCGRTSPAADLVHVSGSHFFAASHGAPSVLFALDPSNSTITVAHELENLAPITDFVAESDRNGNAVFLAGSGGFPRGSLKKIAYGCTLDELCSVEADISTLATGLWAIKDEQKVLVVVSTAVGTRIFHIASSGDWEELAQWRDANLNTPTVLAANLTNKKAVVRATTTDATIYTADSTKTFTPQGRSISFAAAWTHLVLCLDRREIIVLDPALAVVASHTAPPGHDITSLAVHCGHCAYTSWAHTASSTDVNIQVLAVPDLTPVEKVALPPQLATAKFQRIPRSVLIRDYKTDNDSTLRCIHVALDDGTFFTTELGRKPSSPPKKPTATTVYVGTSSPTLTTLDGKLLALSHNGAEIVQYTPATASATKELLPAHHLVTHVSGITKPTLVAELPLTQVFGPGAAVVAGNDYFGVVRIGEDRGSLVQARSYSSVVRKVARLSPTVAVVSCVHERGAGHIQTVDTVSLEPYQTVELQPGEDAEAIVALDIDAIEFHGFAVVTSIYPQSPDGDEPDDSLARGRLLLYSADPAAPHKGFRLEHSLDLGGPAFALEKARNRFTEPSVVLLVALQSEVRPAEILRLSTGRFSLALSDDAVLVQAFATCISVNNEIVSIAGNNKRATVGHFAGPHYIEFSRRIVSNSWLMQTEVTNKTVVVADSMNELVMARLSQPDDGADSETDPEAEDVSFTMPFHDTVNRIRRIDHHWWTQLYGTHPLLAGISPEAYLATVSGGIYLVCHFDDLDLRRELMNIQFQLAQRSLTAINNRVPTEADVNRYVAGTSGSGEFLDGAVLDRFLDLSKSEQLAILGDMRADISHDEVLCVLRALRNLRH